MELRQVQYFLGIAQAGSFGKAADELHVAKSALSRQIGLLETELGAKLFVRGAGRSGVQLTEAGEAFMPEAIAVAQSIESARDSVRRTTGGESGQVTMIAAATWDAWEPWIGLVTAFREQHPGITLRFMRADTVDDILRAVADGKADLGVASATEIPQAKGLRIEHLLTERVLLALPPGHPRSGEGPIDVADLADEPWLIATVDRQTMDAVTRPYGYAPRVDVDMPDKSAVRQLLMAGHGIAPLGESEAPFFDGAEIRELGDPPLTYSLMLVMRKGTPSVGARSSRTFLRRAFGLTD